MSQDYEAKMVSRITEKFEKRFPGYKVVDVEFIDGVFNGGAAAVRYVRKSSNHEEHGIECNESDEDVVFIEGGERIRMFDSTKELVYYLAERNRDGVIVRLTTGDTFPALMLVLLVGGIFFFAYQYGSANNNLLKVVESLATLVAGYFFGTVKGARSR